MYEPFADPVPSDPIELVLEWTRPAVGTQFAPQPMTLATADAEGRPSTRIVMVKDISADGFLFFTSYQSRKMRELASNPYASLLAFWPHLGRQISVTGQARKTSITISNDFFAQRTRRNQVVAWASQQSSQVADRATLAEKCGEVERQYAGRKIPRPGHWGGMVLIPDAIEFWLEDDQQLHSRLLYKRQGDSGWSRTRLAP